MIDFNEMLVFTTVVESGSLGAAARKLELSKSTLSRRLDSLEARLGVRLLERSSSGFRLTPAGHDYATEARALLGRARALDERIAARSSEIRGLLRLTCSPSLARDMVVPTLRRFLRSHEGVRVKLLLTHERLDLWRHDIDLAIRIGPHEDERVVVRRLTTEPRCLVASPSYLATHGHPEVPADLADHRCIAAGASAFREGRETWTLSDAAGGQHVVSFEPHVAVNSMEIALTCCIDGLGIARAPLSRLRDALSRHELAIVLPNHPPRPAEVDAAFPSRKHLRKLTRAFVDELTADLAGRT